MNKEQADKILNLCNKFCVDNDNNKINTWSSGFFISIIKGELNAVLQTDMQKEIEVQKEIDALKEAGVVKKEIPDETPLKSEQAENVVSDETQKKVIDMVAKKVTPKKDKR